MPDTTTPRPRRRLPPLRRFAGAPRYWGILLLSAVAVAGACAASGPGLPRRTRVEFTPVDESEASAVVNPHDYRGGTLCQRCHVRHEEWPGTDPMTLCAQCHDPTHMRHPMGIPKPGGAGKLPLHDGDEIVCHTCHDPHDVKRFPHGLRAEYRDLCAQCHRGH